MNGLNRKTRIQVIHKGLLQFLGTCREQSGTGNTSPGKYLREHLSRELHPGKYQYLLRYELFSPISVKSRQTTDNRQTTDRK